VGSGVDTSKPGVEGAKPGGGQEPGGQKESGGGVGVSGGGERERESRTVQATAATSALAAVGLLHRADVLGRDLSGGERQRLAIARALATSPRVLLADEPTGNLDAANTDAIMTLLRAINRNGVTVIVVTHDNRVAETAGGDDQVAWFARRAALLGGKQRWWVSRRARAGAGVEGRGEHRYPRVSGLSRCIGLFRGCVAPLSSRVWVEWFGDIRGQYPHLAPGSNVGAYRVVCPRHGRVGGGSGNRHDCITADRRPVGGGCP